MSMPERYSFNHTLGVDLIEIADAVGNKYIALNMVDMGTCFELCEVIRSGTGQASAAQCLEVRSLSCHSFGSRSEGSC